MATGEQTSMDDLRTVEGQVTRVTFYAEDTGRSILRVNCEGRSETWLGIAPPLQPGAQVRARGRVVHDPKWGPQMQCETMTPVLPASLAGIEAYLTSGNLPGIGPALGKAIVAKFGTRVFAILDTDPNLLQQVSGIGPAKIAKIAEAWKAERLVADVMAFLEGHGASPSLAARIVRRYAGHALHVVQTQPYRLALEVQGVGFKTADTIAQAIGISPDSPERAQAATLHVLGEGTQRGDCYLPIGMLAAKTAELILRPVEAIHEAIHALATTQVPRNPKAPEAGTTTRLVLEEHEQAGAILYPRALYDAEVALATRLRSMLACESAELPGADKAIAAFEREAKVTLAPEQREAVEAAARHSVVVVTGGPGVGKCLGRGTPVLMFDGSIRPVEAVANGDVVMGPDSKPRRVSGTTRGTGPLYEIRPIKGTPWVCNDVHVLTLVRSGTNEVRDIPLDEYMALGHGAKWREKGKLFKVGVDFPDRDVPMDPYLVGLWLGDGTRGEAGITTAEPEVLDAMHTAATACGYHLRIRPQSGCVNVHITHGRMGPHVPNTFKDGFRELVSNDGVKFIPDDYRINSREKRLALLAGLVDTDGFVDASKCIEITTKWRALADDIAFLARSLGICVTIAEKYVRLEGWDAPRLYFRLILSGHLDQIPCRVPRRRVPPRMQIKDALRTGFEVHPVGIGDYFGFQLDGDGRFLLGDFTVTHNTMVTQGILRVFTDAKIPTLLASPTGRAAKRLSEATGKPASTIHRALGWRDKGYGFAHDANNPLPTGALLLDEVSMMDVQLATAVIQALATGARLVLVGDVDQLPSVGPGAVLRDIIASGIVPTVRLTRIYRQAEGSAIIEQSRRINTGRMPEGPEFGLEDGEFFFTREDDSEAAARRIVHLVSAVLPARYGFDPAVDIQVLTPMHKGACGTIALNAALQSHVNPMGDGLKRGNVVFRVGDPVLQTRNDRGRDVYNGDRGRVVSVNLDDASLVVDFDGRVVNYDRTDLVDLTLAYATSVHKAQGATIPCVVFALQQENYALLSRNLVYTGVTRARRLCVLVAAPRAVQQAVRETRREVRRTRLADRLRGE